ncbi:flavin reductase family protein [Aquisalimonas asiatica]|nr:flavin reductase family protein [Aquisalimonas asiatica]
MAAEAIARSSDVMQENADQRALKRTLGRYPTGVAVVTARRGDGTPVGLTVNSFTSVSLEPPLILWCLANESPNLPVFRDAAHFGISVLAADQQWVSNRFASPLEEKFAGIDWFEGEGGVPLLRGSVAHLHCRHYSRHPGGDHVILLGQVARFDNTGGEPLVYLGGDYHVAQPPGERGS